MSSLLKIQAGRVSNVEASTYVGDYELLWYDETGILRLGDGVTPGGIPLNFPTGGSSTSTVFSNFIPGVNNFYSLGTTSTQWKTLYLSSSTFYVGGNSITVSSTGTLFINGIPIQGSGPGIITTGTYTVIIGYTGSTGYTGSRGIQGIQGYTGSAAAGGSNNLVWTSTGTQRKLTGYIDPNGTSYNVRDTQITNGLFVLNLAGFTPTLGGTYLPSNSINWDVPCSGFSISVTNPTDFIDQWISSLNSITVTSGSMNSNISSYTSSGPSNAPNPGISWTQTFSTNSTATIRPASSTITGGTASANLSFNYKSSTSQTDTPYTNTTVPISVSWNTPTVSISMTDLSGNNFLQSYTQTPYQISVTGMSFTSNYALTVSGTGGTPSNLTGNGNIVFATPIHKNTTINISVSVSSIFTRPNTVTGASYTASLSNIDNVLTAAYTYPSFWLWTPSVSQVPIRTDVVTGSNFSTTVTVLGNQVKNFAGTVNNSGNIPKVFWFGVRSSATQPTQFQTGASASLLSGVSTTQGNVSLTPDTVPSGYIAESYNLYGIVLQPGNTYVSIS